MLTTLIYRKCLKYVAGKKNSAGGEKPATQRAMADRSLTALDVASIPGILDKSLSRSLCTDIFQTFVDMMADDGTQLEPDGDIDFVEE